ncbi:sugar kinase [Mobilicoccus caccae]|uniref:Ribokinase n=1 Tax=Mobilicoccus caccae TaxID=1859295 RepID=A0ABQ6IQ00_9MICO|nr:sugar kinase [Mobilicoccus caccae]GMA38763.1 ribokinase [Mobilicoccus caccae]
MIDLVTFGETMVSFRTSGALVSGAACTAHVAGAESNVAIALSRLGHRARWVGGLTDDALGDLVAATLTGEGVDVVRADPVGRPAGLMLLQRRTADVARVAYARKDSAGSCLTEAPVLEALEHGARRLHVTGITPALSDTARQTTLTVVTEAARRGVAVSLDVNHRAALWSREDARAVLTEIVPHVDLLVASADELDLVGEDGASEEDLIADLADRGCAEVLLKRGGEGATLHRDGRRLDAAARPVTVVDVVGAGDACTAGYLSGRLDGVSDEACLERAMTLGAFAVSTVGDWEGLPRRHELGLLSGAASDVTR